MEERMDGWMDGGGEERKMEKGKAKRQKETTRGLPLFSACVGVE